MTVKEVLSVVGELGFFEIGKQGAICITPPLVNLHQQRLEVFGKMLVEYKKRNPDAILKGFFTLYDAWREHSEPSANPRFLSLGKKSLQLFVGKGTLGEPGRFIQPFFLKDRFPVFKYPVFAFGRHKNDPFVQLLPDPEFFETEGYLGLRAEVDSCDRAWWDKQAKLFWRGSMHGFPYCAYDPLQLRCQRAMLLKWSSHHNDMCDASAAKNVSRGEQLQYRYLLDVDGEVNAWSGLFWKLYSSSVVFKVYSHYEQWYYDRLLPWEHYIPVAGDLSDLEDKYDWALSHDDDCRQIAQSGREFASSLTIQKEFDQLKLVDETSELFSRYSVTSGAGYKIPQMPALTVVHSYRPQCQSVSQPPGFGDFLRGSVALYQLSIKYGFNLRLDFSSHPLYDFIKHCGEDDDRNDLDVHEFFNQRNAELESFLVGQSEMGTIKVITHAVPHRKITGGCRQFLLKYLKPTKALTDHLSSVLTTLNLTSYCTVHFRMGDHHFGSELDLPTELENWFADDILPVWGKNVLVISDNASIKKIIQKKFDIKIIDVNPVHLGQSALCRASGEEVRNTFSEFLLMSRSSWIYQYSIYPWGSSFSEMCAEIFDIPFERFSCGTS